MSVVSPVLSIIPRMSPYITPPSSIDIPAILLPLLVLILVNHYPSRVRTT